MWMDFPADAGHMICHRKQSKRWPLVPISLKLLLEAKKITRYLSLVLTVAGMLMLNLIAFQQPWIHFQVPLSSDSSKSIPIDTNFFMRCPDISCMDEYDKNDCKLGPVLTPPEIQVSSLSQRASRNNFSPPLVLADAHTTSSCPRT